MSNTFTLRLTACVLACFIICSCDGDKGRSNNENEEEIGPTPWYSAEKVKLEANLALWQSHNTTTYQFRNKLSQYGNLPILFERTHFISENEVERVYDETEQQYTFDRDYQNLTTIDGIFDFLLLEIEKSHDSLEVVYDGVWGYPTAVQIDPIADFWDDETAFQLSHFKDNLRRPWYDEENAKLLAAQELWQAANISTYQFNNKVFQYNSLPMPFERIVYVTDNEVEQIYDVLNDQFTEDRSYMQVATIDDAFIFIRERMESNPDELEIDYHETLGFPINIFIDLHPLVYDTEYYIYNSDFR